MPRFTARRSPTSAADITAETGTPSAMRSDNCQLQQPKENNSNEKRTDSNSIRLDFQCSYFRNPQQSRIRFDPRKFDRRRHRSIFYNPIGSNRCERNFISSNLISCSNLLFIPDLVVYKSI